MDFDSLESVRTSKAFKKLYYHRRKLTSEIKQFKLSGYLASSDNLSVTSGDDNFQCRCLGFHNVINRKEVLVTENVNGTKVTTLDINIEEQQYICSLHPTAQQQAAAIAQYNDALDEAIYGSDEFRMYAYKIKRCTRLRSHDWTECPYAHRGEKAQRRDPRKFPYTAIACPAFRTGKCPKGDGCEFAHGVFEYWLHPARYRTRACNAGRFCQRKVCFFAHTPEQLRAEPNYSCHFAYKGKMTNGGDHHHHHHYYYHPADQPMMAAGNIVIAPSGGGGGEGSSTSMQGVPAVVVHERPLPSPSASAMQVNRRESGGGGGGFEGISGVSDLLKSLKALKMREDEEEARERLRRRSNVGGVEVMDSDLPDDLEWISDLVK